MKGLMLSILCLLCLKVIGQLPNSRSHKSNITIKANVGAMIVNEFADGITLGIEIGHKFNKAFELSTSLQISTNYDREIKTIPSNGDPKVVKLNRTVIYTDLQFISNFNLSYLLLKKEHNYDKVNKNDFVFGIGLGALLVSKVSVGKEDPTTFYGSYSNTGQIALLPSIAYRFSYIINFENHNFMGGMMGQNIFHDGGGFYMGLQIGRVL